MPETVFMKDRMLRRNGIPSGAASRKTGLRVAIMLENYKVRFLIFEDSQSLSAVYAAVARQLEAAVRVADTGTQAMAIIAEFQPEIILLDLWLPDVKGMDILRYIQKQELNRHHRYDLRRIRGLCGGVHAAGSL